jgi:hypothetical protein
MILLMAGFVPSGVLSGINPRIKYDDPDTPGTGVAQGNWVFREEYLMENGGWPSFSPTMTREGCD